MQKPEIHDRGRGPEIKGTRITVYDVFEFYRHGHLAEDIASFYPINAAEAQTAIDYIEAHRPEVEAKYGRIMDRIDRGNSPEMQALLDSCPARLEARRKTLLNGHAFPGSAS